jgi:monofunctional biosynthetic peptidoglycan transglycosylase
MRVRRVLRIVAEALVIALGAGLLTLWCSVPSTASLARENPTTTAFIELRRDQAAAAHRKFDLHFTWKPLGQISRYLRAAVVYSEDWNFYAHPGVDWAAMRHAMSTDLGKGSLKIGGSTITQQLAKNLYLSPARSILRKAREILIAYALTDDLSKQRVLELYLNVVEWGDGVFGAEAAARRWFGHAAAALTPVEAARLAIALPNPIARAPNVRSPDLTRKAVRIIRLFRMHGLVDAAGEHAALVELGVAAADAPPPKEHEGPITSPDDVDDTVTP